MNICLRIALVCVLFRPCFGDETAPTVQPQELLSAFELNNESLERYDVLVKFTETRINGHDAVSEKKYRQRIRSDLLNDRVLNVALGLKKNDDEEAQPFGFCLIADGKEIRQSLNLYEKRLLPKRPPSSLKYCFLTQSIPEFRNVGLSDFPAAFKYHLPDGWRKDFLVYKSNANVKVTPKSATRVEVSYFFYNEIPVRYKLTFDLTRNLVVHRELHQMFRSKKSPDIVKFIFMFQESIQWKEVNGVYVPTALYFTKSAPSLTGVPDSEEQEVHLTWLSVNEEFDQGDFDVALADSYEQLQTLVADPSEKGSDQLPQ